MNIISSIIVVIKTLIIFYYCGCSSLVESVDSEKLFGAWKLERIVYDTGEVLTPESDQLYWLDLMEDLVEAEGGMHHFINGGAYCNWAQGWFDYTETGEINITLICSRAICGISDAFCTGVTTSYKYEFRNSRLILSFEYPTIEISPNKGKIILKPFEP